MYKIENKQFLCNFGLFSWKSPPLGGFFWLFVGGFIQINPDGYYPLDKSMQTLCGIHLSHRHRVRGMSHLGPGLW